MKPFLAKPSSTWWESRVLAAGVATISEDSSQLMKAERINRRHFLHTSLLGSSAALAIANLGGNALGAVTKPERDPDGGLKLGMASYTFRNFTLEQAIA